MELKPEFSDRIIGMVSRDAECIPRSTFASPLPEFGLPDIANDKSLSVWYRLPEKDADYAFKTTLLKGVKLDNKMLTWEDAQFIRSGGNRGGRKISMAKALPTTVILPTTAHGTPVVVAVMIRTSRPTIATATVTVATATGTTIATIRSAGHLRGDIPHKDPLAGIEGRASTRAARVVGTITAVVVDTEEATTRAATALVPVVGTAVCTTRATSATTVATASAAADRTRAAATGQRRPHRSSMGGTAIRGPAGRHWRHTVGGVGADRRLLRDRGTDTGRSSISSSHHHRTGRIRAGEGKMASGLSPESLRWY
ncbi:hypothetical protein BC937DRAFT_88648 [Endogone sp. FLAS-F59071]|nr:hypothetical protein BC937DRAFT_88648 [Endogone sp. FLAS-F59071]|eukprot:RUS18536.1 hypothetical protein BC937DRAFT_88648 [Endogone sp. FLAS-F59071]